MDREPSSASFSPLAIWKKGIFYFSNHFRFPFFKIAFRSREDLGNDDERIKNLALPKHSPHPLDDFRLLPHLLLLLVQKQGKPCV